MKAETKISSPQIDFREEQHYMGIRTIGPFKGMFAEVTLLMNELRKWVNQQHLQNEGPYLLRYHTIDMKGPMDIEVGFIVKSSHGGNDRVKPNKLPSGRYANLTYSGNGFQGHKTLIEWAHSNKIPLDRKTVPEGDSFCCRYEAYLTDYRIESRKLLWEIELAIKIADD